jgi:hypothetical protein
MHEMPMAGYGRLHSLAADQAHSLAVGAALAGCSPATILVDDIEAPQAALLQIVHRLYLLGRAGDPVFTAALRSYLAGVVVPARLAVDHHWLSVYDDAGGWHEALPELFPGAELHAAGRIYLERRASPRTEGAALPPGYALRPVDAALMAQPELVNYASLREEMCSERVSVEAFLAHSFGVCVLYGDEIAGWCLSEYNCGDRCEVGIETTEPHRQRGLATTMTQALCAAAFAGGITTVGWHCLAANAPSYATARKAGFEEVCRYRSHYVRIGG